MVFKEKYFSRYILLTDQISLSDCPRDLVQYIIIIACFPGCDLINSEINLSFLIEPFLT